MKIKQGYILKENILGDNSNVGIVISLNKLNKHQNCYMQLNETGIFIWKMLEKGATVDEVVSAILKEYNAPCEVVKNDVLNVVSKLKEIGAIDE